VPTESELDELARAASELVAACEGNEKLARRAARLAERLSRHRFDVAVLGEFKRGKSTLVNALLGTETLPTGAVPLTSVVTEVAYGEPGATVVHQDGEEKEIALAELASYVTETANPGNALHVERVEARLPVELLRPGVVLVDTPGTGSVFHHDEAASRALLEADGAIVVLSADAPLSEDERKLLAALSDRQGPTFFVLNRVDHLSPAEREEVTRFVGEGLSGELGRQERIWPLSARAALAARLAGQLPSEKEAGSFASFYEAFTRFINLDLVGARLATARAELVRLAQELEGSLALQASASELDAATLAERVAKLRAAAAYERQAFDDERTLLRRDVAALVGDIERRLSSFAASQPAKCEARLFELARATPISRLEDVLRREVEALVRESFEQLRHAEAEKAETSWRALAERFHARTQARVDAVRAAAADIFQVELPPLAVPQVAEERERYFYLFLHVGTSTETIGRAVRLLLPRRAVRRRLLERARHDLARELDKHAGRARWDLAQRLDAVRRRFEAAMAAELGRSVSAILEAAARAEERHAMAEAERELHKQANEAARKAAQAALLLAGGAEAKKC
jgi:small GTP-binding protein